MPTESPTETCEDHESAEANGPGEILRQARLEKGLSEKEVADKLHITMHYVRSLESGCYEKLPGTVFARGYMKSYAELLGVDGQDVLEQFDVLVARKQQQSPMTTQQVRRRRDRNRPFVIGSVVLFIAGFAGLWLYNQSLLENAEPLQASAEIVETESSAQPQRQAQSRTLIYPASDASTSTPTATPANDIQVATVTPQGATPAAAGIPAVLAQLASSDPVKAEQVADTSRVIEVDGPGEDKLRISFSGESWVQVDDGSASQIYRDIREAGDVLEITGTAPFNILLGDAPFTRLSFNGTEIDVSDDIRIDNSARLTVGL